MKRAAVVLMVLVAACGGGSENTDAAKRACEQFDGLQEQRVRITYEREQWDAALKAAAETSQLKDAAGNVQRSLAARDKREPDADDRVVNSLTGLFTRCNEIGSPVDSGD